MAKKIVTADSLYIADLLDRRYATVVLNADRQLTAALREQDRTEILSRANAEMAQIDRSGRILQLRAQARS